MGHTTVPSSESTRASPKKSGSRNGSKMGPCNSPVRSTSRVLPSLKPQPAMAKHLHRSDIHIHHRSSLAQRVDRVGTFPSCAVAERLEIGPPTQLGDHGVGLEGYRPLVGSVPLRGRYSIPREVRFPETVGVEPISLLKTGFLRLARCFSRSTRRMASRRAS